MKGYKTHIIIVAIAVVIVAGALLVSAIAQTTTPRNSQVSLSPPSLPAVFYGSLIINNKPIKDGAKIEAFVDNVLCSQNSKTRRGMYVAVVRGNDATSPGCAESGDEAIIKADGKIIHKAIWQPGAVIRKDLKITQARTRSAREIISDIQNSRTRQIVQVQPV